MNRKIMGCLLLITVTFGYTQRQGFPVRVLVGNEATALPYSSFWSNPVHPSFQLGTEIRYNNHQFHYWYQTINAGFIYHENLYQGAYLNTELGYDYRLGFGLNLKGLVGVGYLHTFAANEEYQFEDGEYLNGKDSGNSRVMPSLSMGLGYRINRRESNPLELMLLYQSRLEFPYSPGFISLMPHTNLSMGVKFYIN